MQDRSLAPIFCAPLIRKVDRHLIALLKSLTAAGWNLQTVAPRWKVRDVAAHLLDTQLRKLSLVRDACLVEAVAIHSPADLSQLVHRLNREGVDVYRRLSPPVLIELLAWSAEEHGDFVEALDPLAIASFSVSWAGESQSLNWFDTARELTERWHHQQQIRVAVNQDGIMTPELYRPVLDCFLRGLPHHFSTKKADPLTTISVEIDGECGGVWLLERAKSGWGLVGEPLRNPVTQVRIPQEIAWRIFTNGLSQPEALAACSIEGDRTLGEWVLSLRAIVI